MNLFTNDFTSKNFGDNFFFKLPTISHQLALVEPFINNYILEINTNKKEALKNYEQAVFILCWITRDPRWKKRRTNKEIERAWEVLRDTVLNSSQQFNDSIESLYEYFNDFARVVKRERNS